MQIEFETNGNHIGHFSEHILVVISVCQCRCMSDGAINIISAINMFVAFVWKLLSENKLNKFLGYNYVHSLLVHWLKLYLFC